MTNGFVVLAAVAAIIWVNWYFIFSGRRSVAASTVREGVQEVTVRVAGGYDPSVVRVRKGVPVRLVFQREETSGCSEELVVPDFGIRKFLPPHQRTAIEITPTEAGEFDFTCGMGMLRGRLIVEEESGQS